MNKLFGKIRGKSLWWAIFLNETQQKEQNRWQITIILKKLKVTN